MQASLVASLVVLAVAPLADAKPSTERGAHIRRKPAPIPAWHLGDAKEKFEDLGKQIDKADFMHRKVQVPAHVRANATHALQGAFHEIIFTHRGGCGEKVSTKNMGINPKAASLMATKMAVAQHPERLTAEVASFLQSLESAAQHPGEDSYSKVGSGGSQKRVDEGRSSNGAVLDAKGDYIEPFVTVLKDGFFEVGCFTDQMLEFADKYGKEKDKYGSFAKAARVSIVHYNEIVLEEKRQPMTQIVCFEFCRTLPDMVFFGINNGNGCYCMPYYKPGPSDNTQCDVPCPGDSTEMCGNRRKSSVFEMHLCAETGARLMESMTEAKQALDFYFEEAVMSNVIGSQMVRSGIALEKMGGDSGAMEASQNGKSAQIKAKKLSQAYQPTYDAYTELLAAYKDAHGLLGSSFSSSADANLAEYAMRQMRKTVTPVLGGAAEMHTTIKLAYPVIDTQTFGDDPDANDPVAVKLSQGKDASYDFRPASYAWDKSFVSPQSSCTGPAIGAPIVGLGIKDCARVCEATVHPEVCRAFAFYQIVESEPFEGKGLSDLCFLFSDIKRLKTFACTEDDLLLQGNASSAQGLRGGAQAQKKRKAGASGRATCMVSMSQVATGFKPTGDWKQVKRCFSTEETGADGAYASFKMPVVAQMELDGKDTIAAPP